MIEVTEFGERVQMPVNYKAQMKAYKNQYSDAGATFPDGFQKDAIQNSIGAVKDNKWHNWCCDIYEVNNEIGKFLVVEDSGTVGLIGKNISLPEIHEMVINGEKLDGNERLARFESQYNSGENIVGAGLYGIGKSVYSIASNTFTYYFDSLRDDNLYVANSNQNGTLLKKALVNDDAKKYIKDVAGLAPKVTNGTRIIIADPSTEIIESIHSGQFIKYIQESWWLMMKQFDETSSIKVNHVSVQQPNWLVNVKNRFETNTPEPFRNGYRVKKFGFFVYDKTEQCPIHGVSYYRRHMKIGEVSNIKGIPDSLEGKYWGYIEVDKDWENELAEIEDSVHFGISKGKKMMNAYQYLRNYSSEKIRQLLIGWGYVRDKENENRKLKEQLEAVANDIQNVMDNMGYETLGKGMKKPDFSINWKDVDYPKEENLEVTTDDVIQCSYVIHNNYSSKRKFHCDVSVYSIDGTKKDLVGQFESNDVTIESGMIAEKEITFPISQETSKRYYENKIILTVSASGTSKRKNKELIFFFDTVQPDRHLEKIDLTPHTVEFPRKDSVRVNYGESIRNLSYLINNNREIPLHYKLNIALHLSDETAGTPEIKKINSVEGTVKPFEEIITAPIKEIDFEQEDLHKWLENDQGIVEIRARLVSMDDDGQYEKGDKITKYNFKAYVNEDEKHGERNSFEVNVVRAGEEPWRARLLPGRVIEINAEHPAFQLLSDQPEEIFMSYLKSQLMTQVVLMYLSEGMTSMFDSDDESFSDMTGAEAVDQVIKQIEIAEKNIYN